MFCISLTRERQCLRNGIGHPTPPPTHTHSPIAPSPLGLCIHLPVAWLGKYFRLSLFRSAWEFIWANLQIIAFRAESESPFVDIYYACPFTFDNCLVGIFLMGLAHSRPRLAPPPSPAAVKARAQLEFGTLVFYGLWVDFATTAHKLAECIRTTAGKLKIFQDFTRFPLTFPLLPWKAQTWKRENLEIVK